MVDANVFVSGALVLEGPPSQVVDAWLAGDFEIVISPALLAELADVLGRVRIARRIRRPGGAAQLLRRLNVGAIMVTPLEELAVVSRDPDDNRVIEAAVAGAVDFIVSGDDDLRALGSYLDIPIVTPARFLVILEELAGLGES
ncbi:MAG: putative toxin-antitoxin system toxin component, PIN family [Dehalococcoidia bacterium]